MTTLKFDTLTYSKKMKSLGFTEQQAEGQAEALAGATSDFINENIATKTDILLLQKDILAVQKDIGALQKDVLILREDLKDVRSEMKWLFGITTTILMGFMAVLKFLH